VRNSTWLNRLEADHDNLRAALDGLEANGDTQLALKLAGALYRFWSMRGHLAEGQTRLDRLLAADEAPTAARARALNGAAVMAISRGDPLAAKERSEDALALHRRLGDDWGAAYSVPTASLGRRASSAIRNGAAGGCSRGKGDRRSALNARGGAAHQTRP
jgi:non-specific serine/threonine protein kinase